VDAVTDLDGFAEEQRSHSLRRDNDRLKSELKTANDRLLEALTRLDVLEGVDRLSPVAPKWTVPKRAKSSSAMVVAMLTDTHWDIVVRPEDVAGVNEYNRTIATQRTKSWATKLAALPESGPVADVQGLILLWGGDMMPGPIDAAHLVGQEDTSLGTLLYWSEQAAAAIALQAEAYGRVHVVVVVGNHGRQTLKKRTHLKARDNLDWHLAHLVRRQLADDKRVTWQIDEAPDAEFAVYDHRHVLTHGDQASGGSGIGGVFPPIMRMVARKSQRQSALGRPFDHLWLGHFHQYLCGPNWTCSSSLIGYDGFAADNNFLAEPPSQAVAYVTPAGIEWRSAIRPDSNPTPRKATP
jgi:hypothetical protein